MSAAPGRRRQLVRWTGRAVSFAVLAATFVALRDQWSDVDAGLPGPGWLLLAVALNVAGNLLLVDAWRDGAALAGPKLPMRLATDVWGSSQLTRLLAPGAMVASREVLAVRHGIPRGVGAVSTVVELAWLVVGTPVIAIVTLPWWLGDEAGSLAWVPWIAALPLLGLAVVIASPQRALLTLAAVVARLPLVGDRVTSAAGTIRRLPLDRRVVVLLLLRYLLNTVVRLAASLALAAGVVGLDLVQEHALEAIGAFAVGRFIGTITVFSPGGIGPREGTTTLVLGPVLGGSPVLVIVAMIRLVEFVSELLLLGAVRALRLRVDEPDSTPTPPAPSDPTAHVGR